MPAETRSEKRMVDILVRVIYPSKFFCFIFSSNSLPVGDSVDLEEDLNGKCIVPGRKMKISDTVETNFEREDEAECGDER